MSAAITFDILGTPRPQGSKKAFKDRAGNVRMNESGGLEFAAWRNAVAEAAQRMQREHGTLEGPLRMRVVFRFPMPMSRPRALRDFGIAWKPISPDLDKLVRAMCDAFTASRLIADDKLIVSEHVAKVETLRGWVGAEVSLQRLPMLSRDMPQVARFLDDHPSLFEVSA